MKSLSLLLAAGVTAASLSALAQAPQHMPGNMVLPDLTGPVVLWTPAANGQTPQGAIPGGEEQGRPLVLCRAPHNGGTHPGKIVGQACNFGWGGKEIKSASYDVLVGSPVLAQHPQIIRWVPAQRGAVPAGAFLGAREPGRVLPICRAAYQGGVHPGKVVAQNCNFGFGGKEILVSQYEVLVVSRIIANPLPAAQPLAAAAQTTTSGPSARGSSIAGVPGVHPTTLSSMDIESALLAVQSERKKLLESQLKGQLEEVAKRNSQMAIMSQQLAALQMQAATAQDVAAKAQWESKIAKLKQQIDALGNNQQMDMLRLQSLSNKRNEAFDLMTNFIKKMQEPRSQIIGNMR